MNNQGSFFSCVHASFPKDCVHTRGSHTVRVTAWWIECVGFQLFETPFPYDSMVISVREIEPHKVDSIFSC